MKLFISQPMRDKSPVEIKEKREQAIAEVSKEYPDEVVEELQTYFSEFEESGVQNKGLYYLGESLKFLSQADIAVFVDDWYNYRGCLMEFAAALLYGVSIFNLDAIEISCGLAQDIVYRCNEILDKKLEN